MPLKPQNYSEDTEYRPPAAWYRTVNPTGVLLTRLGLAPKGVVVLEIPGRSSGAIRRTPLLTTSLDRREYLVALAGESHWVRNVRANDGLATITRTTRRRARLVELPPSERAPVISAYLARDEDGNQAKVLLRSRARPVDHRHRVDRGSLSGVPYRLPRQCPRVARWALFDRTSGGAGQGLYPRDMKILFIGGTGIISSACAPLALDRGHDVHLMIRGTTSNVRTPAPGARILHADVRNAAQAQAALGTSTTTRSSTSWPSRRITSVPTSISSGTGPSSSCSSAAHRHITNRFGTCQSPSRLHSTTPSGSTAGTRPPVRNSSSPSTPNAAFP